MQEIEILKRLQGKNNTIQLLSYKKVELLYPYHYLLVFPWYENTGRNLSTVSTITLKSLWKQLFTALEYCHSLSIIHRDVAPKNVLISGSPLVLADFGLSKIIVNNKLPTDQSGTLEYMAPVQFNMVTQTNKIGSIARTRIRLFSRYLERRCHNVYNDHRKKYVWYVGRGGIDRLISICV